MNNKLTQRTNARRRQQHGFTLTEIAIVLGIIGLILGAIWAAASAVYANLKTSQAQQGITFAAQQVRTMFAGSNQTGATAAKQNITAPGMFPVSWAGTGAGITGNPWQQNPAASYSYVIGDSGAANVSRFTIELDGISNSGCASLVGFYNSKASTLNGGQIAGLVGDGVVTAAPVAGTPSVNAIETTYATPLACSGAGNTNNFAVTFDMTQM